MSETGIVEIRGREYRTVAWRVQQFRERYPDWSIQTKVQSAAERVLVKATIRDHVGAVMATGYAEELRDSTNILTTSAVEVAETSAIGRCIAFACAGLAGSEIASADETENALAAQEQLEQLERLKAHNEAVRDNIESIVAIKAYLMNDEYSAAYEAMSEIPDDSKLSLWISTKAGGIWTTKERAQMKSDPWTAARKDFHTGETE